MQDQGNALVCIAPLIIDYPTVTGLTNLRLQDDAVIQGLPKSQQG
jgi:hypothetical protein